MRLQYLVFQEDEYPVHVRKCVRSNIDLVLVFSRICLSDLTGSVSYYRKFVDVNRGKIQPNMSRHIAKPTKIYVRTAKT